MLNESSIGIPPNIFNQSIMSNSQQDDTILSDQINQQSVTLQPVEPMKEPSMPKTRILKMKRKKKRVYRNEMNQQTSNTADKDKKRLDSTEMHAAKLETKP